MKKILFFFLFSIAMIFKTFAQNDSIIINQDSKLSKVLELKKIVNQEAFTSGQYTVQIFSGNFKDYQELLNSINEKKEFEKVFFSFETPYYKIRVGKYVSKIKAIRELKKIKKKYPSAFILQPN
jgi:hypothetical protein